MIRRSMMARGRIAFLAIIILVACAGKDSTGSRIAGCYPAGSINRLGYPLRCPKKSASKASSQ